MCETLAAKLEESWQPIAASAVSKRSKKDRHSTGKRKAEFGNPIPKVVKTQESEIVGTQGMPQQQHHQLAPTDSTPVVHNQHDATKSNVETIAVCSQEYVSLKAESIPSSPLANVEPITSSQPQTPPTAFVENTPPSSQNLQLPAGPKIFVSEMLINQRELYLELVSRSSRDAAGAEPTFQFQICETSLDLPDLAFSATSCALVFSSSEFWTNIQVLHHIKKQCLHEALNTLARNRPLNFQTQCRKFCGV